MARVCADCCAAALGAWVRGWGWPAEALWYALFAPTLETSHTQRTCAAVGLRVSAYLYASEAPSLRPLQHFPPVCSGGLQNANAVPAPACLWPQMRQCSALSAVKKKRQSQQVADGH